MADRLGDTVVMWRPRTLVDTLVATLFEKDAETLDDARGDFWTLALVDSVARTRPDAEANTVDNTLVTVKTAALIGKLAVTLLEAEYDTWG